MTLRAYVFAVLFAITTSTAWCLWQWHDDTLVDWLDAPRRMRSQTRADHAASILFAAARVTLALAALELLRARKP